MKHTILGFGIEPNKFCVEVAKSRMDGVDVYCQNNNDIASFDANILFAFGGVFMHQSSDEISDIFSKIHDYSAIVILDEDCDADLHRSDMTVMHNFKKLLDKSGFEYAHLFKEYQKNSNIYSAFAVWK